MNDHIIDDGRSHKYFYLIPNLIDHLELSVYAHRLYSHLKRVTGETGECFEETTTMAKSCKMSVGSVSNAKKELVKLGLIVIEKKKRKEGGKRKDIVRIVDIWDENISRCSSGEFASSSGEKPSSSGEIKKKLKRTVKEESDLSPLQVHEAMEVLKRVQPVLGDISHVHLSLVLDMVLAHGENAAVDALKNAYESWCSSISGNGRAYNKFNYGWVEWADVALRIPSTKADDGGYDL